MKESASLPGNIESIFVYTSQRFFIFSYHTMSCSNNVISALLYPFLSLSSLLSYGMGGSPIQALNGNTQAPVIHVLFVAMAFLELSIHAIHTYRYGIALISSLQSHLDASQMYRLYVGSQVFSLSEPDCCDVFKFPF